MSSWADGLLVAVVLAPVAGLVLATAAAVPNADRRWTAIGCTVAAAGATVLLVAGQHPQVSRLAPDDLALAAIVAIALLALTASQTPVLAAAVTVASCAVASGVPGQPSTVGPVVGVAVVIALVAVAGDAGRLAAIAMGVGVVVLAAGVHAGGHGGAAGVIAGGAIVAVAGGAVPRRVQSLVVPVVLVLGLRVGPLLSGTPTARWLAVALGVLAAAVVVLRVASPKFTAVAISSALVPWTLAAAIGPLAGTPAAARALAAGTVLAIALGGPLALLAAVPGAAALAYAIADGGGWVRAGLAFLAVATLAGMVDAPTVVRPTRLRAIDAVLLSCGAWLLVRPTSWTWLRVDGLNAYGDGTALALAVALISGVVLAIAGGRWPTELMPAWLVVGDADDPNAPRGTPARVDVPVAVAVALMGLIAVALVRSARL